jgi:hypothetical protein
MVGKLSPGGAELSEIFKKSKGYRIVAHFSSLIDPLP